MCTGEAVEAIARLEAAKKNWFQVSSEPKDVYFLVDPDGGEPMRYTAEHLYPELTVYSTEALLEVAKLEAERNSVAELYYSADKVQALAKETGAEERLRRHTLPLPLHPVFQLLTQLRNTRTFDQRGLIRFLRAELNAYVDDAVVQKFRHLNLESKGEGSSVVDKGRAGVSRSVMQTIRAANDEIPDTITAFVPVYDITEMLEYRFDVEILVDCLPDGNGKPMFELTTIYSGLQKAKKEALEVIQGRLKQGEYPVIYGSTAG